MDQAQQIIEDNSGPASAPSVKDKNGRAHSDIGRDGEVHPLRCKLVEAPRRISTAPPITCEDLESVRERLPRDSFLLHPRFLTVMLLRDF